MRQKLMEARNASSMGWKIVRCEVTPKVGVTVASDFLYMQKSSTKLDFFLFYWQHNNWILSRVSRFKIQTTVFKFTFKLLFPFFLQKIPLRFQRRKKNIQQIFRLHHISLHGKQDPLIKGAKYEVQILNGCWVMTVGTVFWNLIVTFFGT